MLFEVWEEDQFHSHYGWLYVESVCNAQNSADVVATQSRSMPDSKVSLATYDIILMANKTWKLNALSQLVLDFYYILLNREEPHENP